MVKKVLITAKSLNHEGGVVNYYRIFLNRFRSDEVELVHHTFGSRMERYYSSRKKRILYAFYYGIDCPESYFFFLALAISAPVSSLPHFVVDSPDTGFTRKANAQNAQTTDGSFPYPDSNGDCQIVHYGQGEQAIGTYAISGGCNTPHKSTENIYL